MEQTRKITSIKVQKKNPNRVNICLDEEFAFGLPRIVAAWLHVGQELSEEKIASLRTEDTRERAFQQALKFLNFRQRSQVEVERNLKDHQYPEEVVAEVVDRLRENGLLDDSRFAQTWVENRSEFRPRGKSLLRMELRQRGLQDEAIEAAIQSVDEGELAYQAGLKQARKLADLDWNQFRQKMYGFLARRGFDYEYISPVVERIWQEKRSDQPE
ncbi:MAG: RecX family transcriptional regulator [Anaerolineales bacterium]